MILRPLLATLLFATAAWAAKIERLAGGGTQEIRPEQPVPALEAKLREPFGVEFLSDGSMVVVEMVTGNRVFRVDPKGQLALVAGTGVKGDAGDGGPASAAQFNGIHNLAIAKDDAIYLADSWNYRVRKLTLADGKIVSVAGTGKKAFGGDGGPAAAASFATLIQIALSPDGQQLYVADIENRRIRRITLATGVVETVAGNGQKGLPPEGADARTSPLVDPRAVVAAADGSFYILERGGHALRWVDPAGKIHTVVGTGKAGLSGDGGPGKEATLNGPKHLCLDRDGTVLIADAENHVIRRFDPKSGLITRVAGTGKKGAGGLGGDPLACELNRPHGVTIAPDGTLIITDSYNDRILRLTPDAR